MLLSASDGVLNLSLPIGSWQTLEACKSVGQPHLKKHFWLNSLSYFSCNTVHKMDLFWLKPWDFKVSQMQMRRESPCIYKILMHFKRGWFLEREMYTYAYTFDIQFIYFTEYYSLPWFHMKWLVLKSKSVNSELLLGAWRFVFPALMF